MLVWLKYQKYPFWPAVVSAPADCCGHRVPPPARSPAPAGSLIALLMLEGLGANDSDMGTQPSAAGPGHLMSVLSHGILSETHAQLPQGVCEQ